MEHSTKSQELPEIPRLDLDTRTRLQRLCYPLSLFCLTVILCVVSSLLTHSLLGQFFSRQRWAELVSDRNGTRGGCDPTSYKSVCCFCDPTDVGWPCCVDRGVHRGAAGYEMYCLPASCEFWVPSNILSSVLAVVCFCVQVLCCVLLVHWLRQTCPRWSCQLILLRPSTPISHPVIPTDIARELKRLDAEACDSEIYREFVRRQAVRDKLVMSGSWRFEKFASTRCKAEVIPSISERVQRDRCLNEYIDMANRHCYV